MHTDPGGAVMYVPADVNGGSSGKWAGIQGVHGSQVSEDIPSPPPLQQPCPQAIQSNANPGTSAKGFSRSQVTLRHRGYPGGSDLPCKPFQRQKTADNRILLPSWKPASSCSVNCW